MKQWILVGLLSVIVLLVLFFYTPYGEGVRIVETPDIEMIKEK